MSAEEKREAAKKATVVLESTEALISRLTVERDQACEHVTALQESCTDLLNRLRRNPPVKFKPADASGQLPVPRYHSKSAAGLDMRSADDVTIPNGERNSVSLGYCLELPDGYVGLLLPRSGLSRDGICVQPGTIDSDYRGVIRSVIENRSGRDFTVNAGDRVAQLVVLPVAHADVRLVEQLSETTRGVGGFGSTGLE